MLLVCIYLMPDSTVRLDKYERKGGMATMNVKGTYNGRLFPCLGVDFFSKNPLAQPRDGLPVVS